MQKLEHIQPFRISVVIQGPTLLDVSPERNVNNVIKSINEFLPGAEIIVSTWAHESLPSNRNSIIVTSDDPGPMTSRVGFVNNINRQVVSTLAGINAASREYVLKLRSDTILTGSAIAVIEEIAKTAANPLAAKFKITTTNLFVRNFYKYPLLFHASDLVQFGHKDDLRNFWNVQEVFKEKEVFLENSSPSPRQFVSSHGIRLVPEQSLTLSWLRRALGVKIDLRFPSDGKFSDLVLWEQVLTNYFKVLHYKNSEVDFPGRFSDKVYGPAHNMSIRGIDSISRRVISGNHRISYFRFSLARLSKARLHSTLDVGAIRFKSNFPKLYKLMRPFWHLVRRLFSSF